MEGGEGGEDVQHFGCVAAAAEDDEEVGRCEGGWGAGGGMASGEDGVEAVGGEG